MGSFLLWMYIGSGIVGLALIIFWALWFWKKRKKKLAIKEMIQEKTVIVRVKEKIVKPAIANAEVFFWLFLGIFLLVFGLTDFLILRRFSETFFGLNWNWGWFAFWVQSAYCLASLRQVGPSDTGVNLLFGKPIQKVNSGLVFVPIGIFQLRVITRIVREKEYPDPERVWRGDGPLPEGKIPPIRVIQGQKAKVKTEQEEKDPLERRMTTEISAIVRYRVADFMTFIQTIGTLEELDRTIEDLLLATLREDLAQKSTAETLKTWGKINQKLEQQTKDLVSSWGVEVQTVRLKEVDVGHSVNSSLRDLIVAGLNRKTTIINATAEKRKKELEGEGLAWARRVLLEAEGFGYQKIAKELGVEEGQLVLFAETVRKLTENSNYTLISGAEGIANLFSVVGAIKDVLEKSGTQAAQKG